MQRLVTGFALGYLTIALLVMPSLLWAIGETSSYSGGISLVFQRSGIAAPVNSYVNRALNERDLALARFSNYVADALLPHLPN